MKSNIEESSGSQAVETAPSKGQLRPQEWPVEALIQRIGRGPTAIGKWLDRVAANPNHSFFGGIASLVVRFFSSVWLGILWLLLVGVYVAVGSGFANLRADFEMTDMQFFNAWPMVTLMILLLVGIITVTLRRIPLTLFKLGSWTVHIGIVTLILGCFIYFGNKHEGSVRIFLNQSVNHYYDATERALYIKPSGDEQAIMIPLPTLPIYHEHLREIGNGLDIKVVVADYAGGRKGPDTARDLVPTQYEPNPLKGVSLNITGYYPYAIMREAWEGVEAVPTNGSVNAGNPGVETPGLRGAIQVGMTIANLSPWSQWLIAGSPAGRVFDAGNLPMGIEYLREPSAEMLADISRPMDGPLGITVRIPKLKIEKAFTVQEGQTIKIDGSPYTLTVGGVSNLPLVSKGYEGSNSSAMMVKVVRDDQGKPFEFERMALFRYPERSPDFINENGKQKRVQDRVDHDIQITFQDATRDQFWFVQDSKGEFTLINRAAGGKLSRGPMKKGQAAEVAIGRTPVKLSLIAATTRAEKVQRPILIPERQRPRASTVMERVSNSVIEMEMTAKDWKKTVYVPFVQFANMQGPPAGSEPAKVEIPGIGEVKMVLSTTKRPLPSSVKLVDFEAIKYPGAMRTFADYKSTLEATPIGGGQVQRLVTQLNAPASDAGLYYFQAAWDGDEKAKPEDRFSVIGVGNRPGIWVMVAGALLMAAGVAFAFYVKPILLRVKKKQLAK